MQGNPIEGHERFTFIRWLDSGSFGAVCLAHCRQTNKPVAVKLIPRGPHINENLTREIFNHRMIEHHHVIQFYACELLPAYIALYLEYADAGNMYHYVTNRRYPNVPHVVGRLLEDDARWYAQQLIVALDYLHHHLKIALRDLKMENILLSTNPRRADPDRLLLKVADLGYSKGQYQSIATSAVGTVANMAPEVLRNQESAPYCPYQADAWGLGCCLYFMVFGCHAFVSQEDYGLPPFRRQGYIMNKVLSGKYQLLDVQPPISVELKHLITRLIEPEVSRRMSIAEATQHPWFLHNLPAGALELNAMLSNLNEANKMDAARANEIRTDIDAIVAAARTLPF